MEEFLKTWGPAIIAAVAIVVLIGVVKIFGGPIQDAFINLFNSFADKAGDNMIPSVTLPSESTGFINLIRFMF